jgi:hypothetical protein
MSWRVGLGTFSKTLRYVFMHKFIPQPSALLRARETAGRRCVSLMFAAAIAELKTQTVSLEQDARVEAASDEWETAGTVPVWQD